MRGTEFSRFFSEKPNFDYVCPTCKKGSLVPDLTTFKPIEPPYSKSLYSHDEWIPEFITYRFSVTCVCNKPSCGEVSYVSGTGGVDQWYGDENQVEFYNSYAIKSFDPSPDLIEIPNGTPPQVVLLLKKCFLLYWVDRSAASNYLRSSLEELLDELRIPSTQKAIASARLTLHARLEIWSGQQSDLAVLCSALKDVGNLGAHGDVVSEEYFFGALEIFRHVLLQLYENNAEEFKLLAKKIQSEIKNKVSEL